MYTHRVTTPDGHEYILKAAEIHTHAVVDEVHTGITIKGGGPFVTWHLSEADALEAIGGSGTSVLVPLWQCDGCDVFDDTTDSRNGSLGDTDQCDTCIDEASRPYRRTS